MSYPAYAEVKGSGVEWLGDVPKDWAVKRMRYVCQLNPAKSEVSGLPPETPVSFLPMEKVGTEGELVLDENRPLEDVLPGFTYFRNADIITAKITPCFENGKGAIASLLTNGIGFGSTEFHVLRPFHSNAPRFIYYLTKSHAFRSWGIASMYGAGGQKRVPEDFIEDFRIAFPPEDEQQQIAAFLDRKTAELDAVLHLKERQLELLAEKRQALISQAVTRGLDPTASLKPSGIPWLGDVPGHWKATPIKALARPGYKTFIDGDWIESPFITNNGVRLLQTGNIGIGKFKEQGFRYISPETFKTFNCTEILPGDVLICRLADPVGRACLAPSLDTKMITSVDVCILKPSEIHNSQFIVYSLSSMDYLSWLDTLCRGGTRDRISRSMLGAIQIMMPPLSEQDSIVTYLDRETARMDRIAQAIRGQIEKIREYRQALISAAVTGKIDVRGEAGSPA